MIISYYNPVYLNAVKTCIDGKERKMQGGSLFRRHSPRYTETAKRQKERQRKVTNKVERMQFKYQYIYDKLRNLLENGRYHAGDRLPTEVELASRFKVSRPTVTRALNALQEEGIIVRKTGSGSFVNNFHSYKNRFNNRLFGLLVPGLGKGEIFEPICTQIAANAEKNQCSLLWSGSEIRTTEAAKSLVDVTQRYIDHHIAGVFFEPLELSPSFDQINRKIISMFQDAGIPIVLVDSDYLPFPERSNLDLVGIDNFRAAYMATSHYLRHGEKRIDFLARPYSAYTISIRLRGYRTALIDYGIIPQAEWIHLVNPEELEYITSRFDHPEASPFNMICGNDETASALLGACESTGISVPEHLRIVGFDDVHYAQMLRVPLTTIHQSVQQIGNLALETLLWRIEHPDAPARTINAETRMIIRESCGMTGKTEFSPFYS